MDKENDFILWFDDINMGDVAVVGGKNAALGEMRVLTKLGINMPNGFAVTSHAYRYFIESAGLLDGIRVELEALNIKDVRDLAKRGAAVRKLILDASLPEDLEKVIIEAYRHFGTIYFENPDVAVRSSATAEDLPGASFAGQQETYLNITGEKDVLISVKKCFASLFTNRAISYRIDKGFSHFDVALSVAIQKMVRSDKASSGVAFSIDTESGFDKVVIINASFGLGEMIVQGKVTPDEYIVFKPTMRKGFQAILVREKGEKEQKMVYSKGGTKVVSVTKKDREEFCLTDDEITTLAKWVADIEDFFSEKYGKYQPMDIEWGKDGVTGELFILQARPETVHSISDKNVVYEYRLKRKGKIITEGAAVGLKIATGAVRIIKDVSQIHTFREGEILVTDITDPDWEPIMKIASAIVTNKGGRTSHAAIVSRELGIPCIVGTKNATKVLEPGQMITIDCSSTKIGYIYDGKLPFEILKHKIKNISDTKTKIMINIGSPDEAFKNHYLDAQGVGLGRLEFIITSHIQAHPNALLQYKKLKTKKDAKTRKLVKAIDALTHGYENKEDFYVEKLTEGISKIAASVWPYPAIIRFSDFKTNEYETLLGGENFEPSEENPMLGWRGASRYYDKNFKDAFILECRALKAAREKIGLTNIIPMVPFCRTTKEAELVLAIMSKTGLSKKTDNSLKIYMMCEIPSNIILAEDFLKHFDGYSIGSNDLTQLILGIDRDSEIVTKVSNENDLAVKKSIQEVIRICKRLNKYIGICGQAPSDYPDFAAFLVSEGIESISLNPDVILSMRERIADEEKKQKR